MQDKITFVVVTYQSSNIIDDCVAALHSIPRSEIVVIDNASTDGTADRCRDLGTRVHSNVTNRGFATAANFGAKLAGEGIICFINPDCYVTVEAVDEATDALKVMPTACAVPYLVDPSGRLPGRQPGKQPGYTWRKLISDVLDTSAMSPSISKSLKEHPQFHDQTWHWPLGTCLFINRERFISLGGFDTRYFMYMEDVEFGLTLSRSGGEVIQLAGSVLHKYAQSSDVTFNQRVNLLDDARIRFGRRHYGLLTATALFSISQFRRLRD